MKRIMANHRNWAQDTGRIIRREWQAFARGRKPPTRLEKPAKTIKKQEETKRFLAIETRA